ncbi:hypothetical protein HWV62_40764 [Athelia sp. TMB]|nr:hypothetical protein HWV62_40764 [Athelia sp. TMB]
MVWSKNSDGQATITAQGDGVHVIDTLGPSTFFSCPSVSQTTAENGTFTYAVIESASDVDVSESGRTVWLWKPEGETRKKHSAVVSHKVIRLYLPEDLPSRLVLLSPHGDITLLDSNLTFKSTLQSENQLQTLHNCFIFGLKTCTFVSHDAVPPIGAVVLAVIAEKENLRLRVVSMGDDDAITHLGECNLPFGQDIHISAVSGVTCSESGYLTLLSKFPPHRDRYHNSDIRKIARSGIWNSFQLECTADGLALSAVSEPLHLAAFSAFSSSKKPSTEISLLSLGSSFVLLAGLTKGPAREVVFLLWDLQYSVLLASHVMPLPSTLAQAEKTGLHLELAGVGKASQATLVLAPSAPQKNADKSGNALGPIRSTVLSIPFTLPETSTIASAMGQASASSKWLSKQNDHDTASGAGARNGLDQVQTSLLRTMSTSIEQNRPEAASIAFLEWTEKRGQSQNPPQKSQGNPERPYLGHEFVRALLNIVLQPSKGGNLPYSDKVIRWLLEQRSVSAEMVEGGLIIALKQRGDWARFSQLFHHLRLLMGSIVLAFETVLDISESDMISLLQAVIKHHRGSAAAEDAMQVDSVPLGSVPSLPAFLFTCVSYATSPAPLRLALRQHMPAAEDVMVVLEVLDEWISEWNAFSLKLVPSMVVKNPKGVTIAKPQRIVKAGTPHLHLVIGFLQSILDASFLALLQHPPAHTILQRICSDLEPEISRVHEMEQLRGPLEPFARAQMKALRESAEGKKDSSQVDWRKKRRAAHEQAGMNVGLYRLEELAL